MKNIENKHTLEDLEKALIKEEFILHYQPYFNLENNDIGIEALIRWQHPQYGLLFPADFLGLAEETGFILKLEKWVLNKAIESAKKLKQIGLPLMSVSVNISANQLVLDSFPQVVKQILAQHSFNAKNLTLEITERFLVESASVTALKKLKRKGVRISIDDFGVAYSSLNYLRDLPIDELKIDRSFISNITFDKTNRNIVEVIIDLANKLDLTVVAEGVETKEQLKLLEKMKCSRVQGFYFSKALSFKSFISKYKDKFL